jgi:uncharacterized membrane protein
VQGPVRSGAGIQQGRHVTRNATSCRERALATLSTERPRSIVAVQTFDWVLSLIAGTLLALVAVALVRGSSEWSRVPTIIWAHVLTIAVALALTPVMLLRRRGDYPHRVAGRVWVSSMMLTALLSFWVRGINGGSLSWIHILSALTIILAPRIVLTAPPSAREAPRRRASLDYRRTCDRWSVHANS